MFRSYDVITNFFAIIAGVLQEDTLGPRMFVIRQDSVIRMLLIKKGFTPKEKKKQEVDDIALKL